MIKMAEFKVPAVDGGDRYYVFYSTQHKKWWVIFTDRPLVCFKREVRALSPDLPDLEDILRGASRVMEQKIGEVLNEEDLLGWLWDFASKGLF